MVKHTQTIRRQIYQLVLNRTKNVVYLNDLQK